MNLKSKPVERTLLALTLLAVAISLYLRLTREDVQHEKWRRNQRLLGTIRQAVWQNDGALLQTTLDHSQVIFGDRERQRLLTNAAERGQTHIIHILLDHAGRRAQSLREMVLYTAAGSGQAETVRDLLDQQKGCPPDLVVSALAYPNVLKLLLQRGANVDWGKGKSLTPICWAAMRGLPEAAKLLLDAGADVNAPSVNAAPARPSPYHDRTPLMFAARSGHADMVRLLLNHGANPNYRSKNGWTALSLAQQYHHLEIVRMLRQAGERE